MIQINKFENVFGIKKLNIDNSFKRCNVVYAPNGTAKTTLCDGLVAIRDHSSCRDVLDASAPNPCYELVIDGVVYNETHANIPLNILSYSGVKEYDLINDPSLSVLAIPESVKNKIRILKKKYDFLMNKVEAAFSASFPKSYMKPHFIKALRNMASSDRTDKELLYDCVVNVDLKSVKPFLFNLEETDFFKTSNTEVKKKISDVNVKRNAIIYDSIIKTKMNDDVLDNEFKLDNLVNVYNSAVENYYFDKDGKRQFYINKKPYGLDEIKTLINLKEKQIYGSKEAEEGFKAVTKALGRNEEVRSFRDDVLKKHQSLCIEMKNYNHMLERMLVTILGVKNVKAIDSVKRKIVKIKQEIDTLISSSPRGSRINLLWEKYKHLFQNKKFDLVIKNKKDVYLGLEGPVFAKCYPGTSKEIVSVEESRFCTGEIRLFNFINFIIEVESKIANRENFTIMLDDPVESFDYKNKYGIIEYIIEISKCPRAQIVILTHNFDFYRSICTALSWDNYNLNKYFGYRYDNKDVIFYLVNNKRYYFTVVDFNRWKSNVNSVTFFALVPFMRNIIQLSKNRKAVKKLDEYFHYKDSMESIDNSFVFDKLEKKLNCNIQSGNLIFSRTDSYLSSLSNVVHSICLTGNIDETALEYKIVNGLFLRIFLERYLWKKYYIKVRRKPRVSKEDINRRTRTLIDKCIKVNAIQDNELYKVEEINVICPAYIHVNSFMYEPLIDVGAEALTDAATWLYNENMALPL